MDKDDKKGIISILMDLISIPSLSGAEDDLASYIKGGLNLIGIPYYEDEGNIYVIKGKPEFVIATHMDTVPSWGHPNAFRPYWDGERIWGRGAVDTKGQIAVLLQALKKGKNFFVVFFRDEEEGGSGSKAFQIPGGLNIKGGIVLEPTSLKMAISQAGSIEIEIMVKGKASHGTIPRRGKNAIEEFFKLFQSISSLPHLRYNNPFFPSSGINLAYINGGTDTQVVPDSCIARMDIPILPDMDLDQVLKEIDRIIKSNGHEYKIIEKNYPWRISQDEWIVKKVKEVYEDIFKEPVLFCGMPAWTDASNLLEKGIPCIIIGAGDLACAHTPYENIEVEELYKFLLVIEKLIQ